MKTKNFFLRIKNSFKGNPLKSVGLGGLILILALGVSLAFFMLFRNLDIFPRRSENPFSRDLRNYDTAYEIERVDLLVRRLDQLERRARGQEEWLSLLKRRRSLAQRDQSFLEQYQRSAQEGLRSFPNSEAINAVAGESLILDPAYQQRADLLRNYAGRLSQPRFSPVALSLYVLAGDLRGPGQAAAIPGIERLMSSDLSQDLSELIMVEDVLLGINRGEIIDTAARLNRLLNIYPESRELLALGGEFFYDHGNPLRAAELYSRLGDSHISKAADSLAMAGEIPGARNIWIALGSTGNSPDIQARSLYNLASTAANEIEAASWIGRLFTTPVQLEENLEIYSTILYSRYQNTPRGIMILEEGKDIPLIDLELLRRRMENMPLNRITAEVWLLLGRHPDAIELYQWGAWFFDMQRLFAETAQLIRIATHRRFEAPWMDFSRSLTFIREGRTDEGLRILENIDRDNPYEDWRILANIARVQESLMSFPAALANYESAARLSRNPRDSSRLQLRIGRCLEAIGRHDESRRALQYALDLDPDNIEAASLLRRRPGVFL